MLLESLQPGRLPKSPGGLIVDWHDRPICAIVELRPGEFAVTCLIAWSFTKTCGIRLYFPAQESLLQELQSQLKVSWEETCNSLRIYVEEFVGEIAVASETDLEIIDVRLAHWPLKVKLDAKVCDVDSTMNNSDFEGWQEFIAGVY